MHSRMQQVDIAQVAELHRKLDNDSMKRNANSLGSKPMLVISARGKTVSSGSMLGNVAKGAVNVIATIGSRQAAKVMDFDKDTIDVSIQLVEQPGGNILWQAGKHLEEDPGAGSFDGVLKMLLHEFPRSQSL